VFSFRQVILADTPAFLIEKSSVVQSWVGEAAPPVIIRLARPSLEIVERFSKPLLLRVLAPRLPKTTSAWACLSGILSW
jgi:hypothetical protein